MNRRQFRETVFERDDGCIVPECNTDPVDAHHIIERKLWDNGGYFPDNGAAVCERHHRLAERNIIPPQAFWHWANVSMALQSDLTPTGYPLNINKWGDELSIPPWKQHRARIKYPSTGHLPFSPEWDGSRVDHRGLDEFVDTPIVITKKMDGSCVAIDSDKVAARNGQHANHESFDYLKQMHASFGHNIPDNVQIFGEWLYEKHSIHYVDALELESYFQPFAVYNTDLDLWYGWDEVENWATGFGFPTVPVIKTETYPRVDLLYEDLVPIAESVVDDGHEGIVVRSKHPYHYGQFERRVGKYVREDHVDTDRHWKQRDNPTNDTTE